MDQQNTYKITLTSGRKWTVRPLPKHFFIYYGQLPTSLMEQAVEAVKSGGAAENINPNMTADEVSQLLIFMREAVNLFCVNPRISLNPKGKNEISPFEITETEFNELAGLAMKSAGGGMAEGLNSFRTESEQTSAHRADG